MGKSNAAARRAVEVHACGEERQRRADDLHLDLFKALAGDITLNLACSETCHAVVGGKSCSERGEPVERFCPSCRALHHACQLEESIRELLRGRR